LILQKLDNGLYLVAAGTSCTAIDILLCLESGLQQKLLRIVKNNPKKKEYFHENVSSEQLD